MNPTDQLADQQPGDQQFVAALRAALRTAGAARVLASPSITDTLLDGLVRTAARAIPSPEGALLLVDRARQVLTFDVAIGQTAATVTDLTVPLGHGVAGLVAVSGQALAIANAQEDPRHARDIAAQTGYLPATILAVPVSGQDGTTVGVLELLDRQDQATYSLADMDLLGVFARQIGLVLDVRRTEHVAGALVGQALAGLAGLPPSMATRISEQAAAFAARVDADPATQQAVGLATLVAGIAARGPAELEACTGVLDAFARYLRTTPEPGMGLEMFA